MIEILLLMFGGMLAGYLLRRRSGLIRTLEKLIIWSIFLLLFFLGVAIGRDPVIMAGLPTLGLSALLLSTAGVLGSILGALLIWKFYFSRKQP